MNKKIWSKAEQKTLEEVMQNLRADPAGDPEEQWFFMGVGAGLQLAEDRSNKPMSKKHAPATVWRDKALPKTPWRITTPEGRLWPTAYRRQLDAMTVLVKLLVKVNGVVS